MDKTIKNLVECKNMEKRLSLKVKNKDIQAIEAFETKSLSYKKL